MHLIYKHLSGNASFQYHCFFFLNLMDLFLQCAFLNPPICCLNSCLWPWNSKFMMSSSAFFFFSKGIVFKNENSMEIFPYPFTPSPFLLLINVALASILEEKKKEKESKYFYQEGNVSLRYATKKMAYLWLTNITNAATNF